jgi:serine/threonine-protein kinase
LLTGCGASQSIAVAGAAPRSYAFTGQPERAESSMLTAARTAGSPEYKAVGPLVFVSNTSYTGVTVYRAKSKDPAPIANILNDVDSPPGDCLDKNGTLYVTNQPINGNGWVSEYPLGKTTASNVITNGTFTPAACAIDSNGNLWVTNIGGPNVTEYLHGSENPHRVITRGLAYPVGVAIDSSGNLYVSDRANSDVAVYAPGSKRPSRTITDGVTSPVDIAIDANGVLYVENITQKNVEEYLPGEDQPFQTITHGVPTPSALSVNEKGWLYVANGAGAYDNVVEFAPGSLKPSKRKVDKDVHGPDGVAYYPPVLP